MTTTPHPGTDPALWQGGSAPPPGDDSIEILAVVASLVARWRIGLVVAVLAGIVGTIYVVHLPSKFEATTTLLPHETSSSAANPFASFFGASRQNSSFLTLLNSRSLRDDVVRRIGLRETLHTTSEEAARGTLNGMTKIGTAPDGLIILTVRSRNANEAVTIANAYIGALRSMQEHMAEVQADLQRRYFQGQLQQEKDALAAAEQDLERTQQGSGIVEAGTQTQIGLSAIAATRQQITSLQVQLAALLQSATDQNPQVKTLRSQIAQLQAEQHSLEAGAAGGAGVAPPTSRMNAVNLAIARKQREVRYHEQLVSSLASHFDTLRLADSTLGDNFDVIDQPVLPETPTWPPRSLFLLFVAAASLLAGLLAVLLAILVDRIWQSPAQRAHLHGIAAAARRRRSRQHLAG